MSQGGINNSIKDGALGVSAASATGIFCAVGVSANLTNGVVILNDPVKAHEKLGDGPLRDTVVSALSLAKATCYVVSVAGAVPGTYSDVVKPSDNSGVGTISLLGTPKNEYDVEIVIDETGGLNEGVFHYVLDGNISEQITIPDGSGEFEIPGAGIKVKFEIGTPSGDDKSYVQEDSFTFKCNAPTASNSEILGAVDQLLNTNYIFEWINIAGVSSSALWAALDSKAAGQEALGRYFYFKCQARYLNDDEDVDSWVEALTTTERGTTTSTRVQVYAGWITESDTYGAVDQRGSMNLGTGMSARRDVHEPVDATEYGAVPSVVALLPPGINSGHIDALDNAGYATFCQYNGESGVYVTHGRMTAPQTSDFGLEERRRVMDYALNAVKKAQFIFINSTVEIGSDGSLEGIESFRAVSEQPLKNMKKLGKISDCEVLIDGDQDILSTETIVTTVRIVPLGKMTWIENEFAFKNPTLGDE